MKTLINILIVLSLSSFLLAQTDSTATEAPLEGAALEAVEPAADIQTDTTETEELVEAEAVDMDSTLMEVATLDSMTTDTTAFVAEDTVITPDRKSVV